MVDKLILVAYGIFLLVGGFFGFRKGSIVSLIMGVASGSMVFLGLWFMAFNVRGAWGILSGLIGVLTLTFLIRVIKTKMFMPSGMLLTVSLLVLTYCLVHLK